MPITIGTLTGSGVSALLAAVIYETARRRAVPHPVADDVEVDRELVVAR